MGENITKISRRGFLGYSGLFSLNFIPGLNDLTQLLNLNDTQECQGFVKYAYRLCNYTNLMNLEFYFVTANDKAIFQNEKKDGFYIRYGQDEVYMIVRLPQQHVVESYFDFTGNDNIKEIKTANSIISGYSFLTFRFVFPQDEKPKEKPKENPKHYFEFLVSYENLLDWNNPNLRLVVKNNIKENIFKKNNNYPLLYNEKKEYDLNKFPSYEQITENDPSPITAIEAPVGLILSPQLPDQDKYEFHWEFSETSKNKLDSFGHDYELWVASLLLKKRPEYCVKNNKAEIQTVNESIKVQIIGTKYSNQANQGPFKENVKVLPEPKDLYELVNLYTIWKLTAKADKMAFSPLGITTNIEFKNTRIEETSVDDENGSTLLDWKQYISIGRDEQVEVARLVLDAETGLKMIHLKTTKRRVYKGNALLHYREYLEPLEFEKDYSQFEFENQGNNLNYHTGYNKKSYKYNLPYKKIEFIEKERKQIKTIAENKNSYWPISKEDELPLRYKFKITHWDNNFSIVDKKLYIISQEVTFKKEEVAGEKFRISANDNPIKLPDYSEIFKVPINIVNFNFEKEKERIEIEIETSLSNVEFKYWLEIEKDFGNIAREKASYFKNILSLFLKEIDKKVEDSEEKLIKTFKEEYYVIVNKHNQLKTQLIGIHDLFFNGVVNELEESLNAIVLGNAALSSKIKQILISIKKSFEKISSIFETELIKSLNDLKSELEPSANDKESIKQLKSRIINNINKLTLLLNNVNSTIYQTLNKDHKLVTLYKIIGSKVDTINQIIFAIKSEEAEIKNRIELGRQKINYVINNLKDAKDEIINEALSQFETEYLILSANFKKYVGDGFKSGVLDFFDDYATHPQLYEAKVYIESIKDLVNEDIPVSLKLAKDYYENQANELYLDLTENASKVFAEISKDSQEYLKGTLQKMGQEFGGIVNPELPMEYITFLQRKPELFAKNIDNQISLLEKELKNAVKEEEEKIKGAIEELKKQGTEALEKQKEEIEAIKTKLLTAVESEKKYYENLRDEKIKELQQSLTFLSEEAKNKFNEIKEYGENQVVAAKEYFKDLEAKILGQIQIKDILGLNFELPKLNKREGKIEYQLITDKIEDNELGPFKFNNSISTNRDQKSQLILHFDKSLRTSQYSSWTRLSNFNVSIMNERLVINFLNLEIKTSSETKRRVNVKLGEIEFNKELAFLKSLSDSISSFIGVPGLTINISPSKIGIGYNFSLPDIAAGAFSLVKLKFFVGVNLPIPIGEGNYPMTTTLGVNSPEDKFVVAVGIFGGRGFFNLTATPKHIQSIDMSIDFGGYLGLNLGVARGEAFLMAGFRYSYDYGEQKMQFYGYLTCGGSLTAFGFISVSATFDLGLKYQEYQGRSTLYGTASLAYSVKVGFFKKSFTLTYSKRLMGSDSKNESTTSFLFREPEYFYASIDNDLFIDEEDIGANFYFLDLDEESFKLPSKFKLKERSKIKKNNKKRNAVQKKEVSPNNLKKIYEKEEEWNKLIVAYNYF